MTFRRALPLLAVLAPLGCAPSTGGPPSEEDAGPGEPVAACTEPHEVECQDKAFQDLALSETVNTGAVVEEQGGPVFIHHIDATAGGAFAADPPSYVYARFEDDGLVKVDINDDEAFTSMDWDIAFRRFIIRVNSGVSGPSCVSVARAQGSFDEVTAVEDGMQFHEEEYYRPQADCELVASGQGLPNAPATALQTYWTYPNGCLKMTGNVFVLQRADGRHLKLQVLSYYYPESEQERCDLDGEMGNGSANIRIQWAFLD